MTEKPTVPVLCLDENKIEGMTAFEMIHNLQSLLLNSNIENIRFEYRDAYPVPDTPPVPVLMVVADRAKDEPNDHK